MGISRVRVSGIRVWRLSQDPPFVFDSLSIASLFYLCVCVCECVRSREKEGRKERSRLQHRVCLYSGSCAHIPTQPGASGIKQLFKMVKKSKSKSFMLGVLV
jgi:hypothetical protein